MTTDAHGTMSEDGMLQTSPTSLFDDAPPMAITTTTCNNKPRAHTSSVRTLFHTLRVMDDVAAVAEILAMPVMVKSMVM